MREREVLETLVNMLWDQKNCLWTYWGVKKRGSEKGPHVE